MNIIKQRDPHKAPERSHKCERDSKQKISNRRRTSMGFEGAISGAVKIEKQSRCSPLLASPPICRIPASATERARVEFLTPLEISWLNEKKKIQSG